MKWAVILGHVTNVVIFKIGIACLDSSVVLLLFNRLYALAPPWNIPSASRGKIIRRNCYGWHGFETVEYYGVRKTAVQQSGSIGQFLVDGHFGKVTDALKEVLGIMREELGQRPGSYTEPSDRSNATDRSNAASHSSVDIRIGWSGTVGLVHY